jgi:hypothetical protein
MVKSFNEFINEGKKGLTNAGSIMKTDNVSKVQTSVNFADESLENLRRQLLDKFFAETDNSEQRHIINKCISTVVYCLDKKLRIDEDIIERLAKETGKKTSKILKILQKETDAFYGSAGNVYGQTS